MNELVKRKVNAIVERYAIKNVKYIPEALFVAVYEPKNQEGMIKNIQMKETSNPNRQLANVGDRVLKLVLTEHQYLANSKSVKVVNDFTNDNEKNKNLAELGIIHAFDGYCKYGDKTIDNTKNNPITIATLVEAVIGGIYLQEIEKTNTFQEARAFIEKHIIERQ